MNNLLTILFVFISVLLIAQERGNLSGKIIDKANGESLPGLNVILKGTYYGVATYINGSFKIEGISVGNYTLEISFIGYKTVQFTGVEVLPNKTKHFDIEMEESVLSLGQEVVIIGEKPLMDVEETQSKRTISKEDIDVSIVENISDLVTQQSGVVNTDNSIHIRGGRSYENAFLTKKALMIKKQ